ncbi:CoA transferase subunit A [Halanaeroarchaeum sulfurireducens]|uniref:3-oxoadipate CoA-transferase subunit alpha n=1 Tax=Halanaeroarchaeum sulfurireducens TaxID=1604004 RepID=A0A0F7PCG5_9EURY|nr:CoA-transferase [Halanaeroarchaeum sulfurireducens]AKH97334.1 3-oxoadipate CoA-transferase subunit alpha [Halanaeroarchaeum sulfurireducens]ALG81736.1 3-oxoadipate CoA-transferase subunit alpha [Halanaeroarchaeum sulfurireducens]
MSYEIIDEGIGELVGWEHPDDLREWNRDERSRELKDKTMTAEEAVTEYVDEGDSIASGGFGQIRISTPIVHEIIRQGFEDLRLIAKTAEFDADLLVAANAVSKMDVAYSFALEARGLSAVGRRRVEEGDVEVVTEASNANLQWRFLAGKMGIPFIPVRVNSGTDTFAKSSGKLIEGPFTGDPINVLPAANPDVAFIHVNKADQYGNAVIDGITVEDDQLSGAAKRLIITAEEIVDNDEIRADPDATDIPFFLVDAVVEAPYGSHPGELPYNYYYDDHHLSEWIDMTEDEEGVEEYLEEYVHGVDSWYEYLEKIGGVEKLMSLERIENYQEKPEYPWL